VHVCCLYRGKNLKRESKVHGAIHLEVASMLLNGLALAYNKQTFARESLTTASARRKNAIAISSRGQHADTPSTGTFRFSPNKTLQTLQTSPNFSKLLQFFGEPLEKLETLSPILELPLYREQYFKHMFNFQQTRLS
jgi:hypothetical protein